MRKSYKTVVTSVHWKRFVLYWLPLY